MKKHALSIEYCVMWNYTPRAVSLTDELLKLYSPYIETLTLKPSSGGRFEVTVDGALIYSKKATGRHVQPGEIAALLEASYGFVVTPAEE